MSSRKGQQARLERLYEQGRDHLDEGEVDKALEVGHQLMKVQDPGGFEIVAEAHVLRDDPEHALEVLEKGTQRCPRSWSLWLLKAIHLSEAERYPEALESVETALRCPGVDRDGAFYNRAVILLRMGRAEETLADLARVECDDLAIAAGLLGLVALNDLGRFDQALESASSLEKYFDVAEDDEDLDPEDWARLRFQVGRTWWAKGDATRARGPLLDSVRVDATNTLAQDLIREVRGERAGAAEELELDVTGVLEHSCSDCRDAIAFEQTFRVVAGSETEALEYIREQFPDEVAPGVTIRRVLAHQPVTDQLKGVLVASELTMAHDEHP